MSFHPTPAQPAAAGFLEAALNPNVSKRIRAISRAALRPTCGPKPVRGKPLEGGPFGGRRPRASFGLTRRGGLRTSWPAYGRRAAHLWAEGRRGDWAQAHVHESSWRTWKHNPAFLAWYRLW